MHDPDAVAFTIRRPWPKRAIGWRYFPALITVWHREPGGRDSGEVCRHYRRWQDDDGKWQTTLLRAWRFHVHHWHLQVHPLQRLRRWALTRCAWCGGRQRKQDPVNVSHQWDGPRGRWWQGEPGLFHQDCSMVDRAHAKCLCVVPVFGPDGGGWPRDYGHCLTCGRFRGWRSEPDAADRILAGLPSGSRLTAEVRAAVEPAWAERRRLREVEMEGQ
jgi:hypothetical protein